VEFVQRAVHAHGDVQALQATVAPHVVHHGGQAGAAELCGTAGHHAAHLLHQDAVVARGAAQAQVLQDGTQLTLRQPVTAPANQEEEKAEEAGPLARREGKKCITNMSRMSGITQGPPRNDMHHICGQLCRGLEPHELPPHIPSKNIDLSISTKPIINFTWFEEN